MGRARGKAKEELTLMVMFMPKDDECEIWIDSVLLCEWQGKSYRPFPFTLLRMRWCASTPTRNGPRNSQETMMKPLYVLAIALASATLLAQNLPLCTPPLPCCSPSDCCNPGQPCPINLHAKSGVAPYLLILK